MRRVRLTGQMWAPLSDRPSAAGGRWREGRMLPPSRGSWGPHCSRRMDSALQQALSLWGMRGGRARACQPVCRQHERDWGPRLMAAMWGCLQARVAAAALLRWERARGAAKPRHRWPSVCWGMSTGSGPAACTARKAWWRDRDYPAPSLRIVQGKQLSHICLLGAPQHCESSDLCERFTGESTPPYADKQTVMSDPDRVDASCAQRSGCR